jgi:hypothetical protein
MHNGRRAVVRKRSQSRVSIVSEQHYVRRGEHHLLHIGQYIQQNRNMQSLVNVVWPTCRPFFFCEKTCEPGPCCFCWHFDPFLWNRCL